MEHVVGKMNRVELQIQVVGKNLFLQKEELDSLDWNGVWPVIQKDGTIIGITDGNDSFAKVSRFVEEDGGYFVYLREPGSGFDELLEMRGDAR